MRPLGVIGYGTLLNRASLARTVGPEAARQARFLPVWVEGYQRLFNLRPDHYQASLQVSPLPIEVGAANLMPMAEARFNGVLFTLGPESLDVLHERERYYERVTARATPFSGTVAGWGGHPPVAPIAPASPRTPPPPEPLEALIYVGRPDSPWVAPWLGAGPDRLLPLWRDLVLARGSAYRIGPEFGRAFDATTYLADGVTRAVTWYGERLPDPLDPLFLDPLRSAPPDR